MLELLSPAGSMESVTAAVQNGANAVYLGYGDFNARRNAKNFTREEVAAAVSYCHTRGTKVHLTLNTLLTDRELPAAAPGGRGDQRNGSGRRHRPGPWAWPGCSTRWLLSSPCTPPPR